MASADCWFQDFTSIATLLYVFLVHARLFAAFTSAAASRDRKSVV